MTQAPYRKLAGRGLTWGGPSRVWVGEDHVLLVLTRGYVEAYRRFFFKDIQGFIVRQTQIGKIWNAVWGACAAFFGLIGLALSDVGTIVMLSLAAPFAVALLINVILGPTCSFHVRTAVQTERLPAVSRVRSAEKFIAGIEPLIAAAQGEVPGEQFSAELERLQNPPGYATATPPVMGP